MAPASAAPGASPTTHPSPSAGSLIIVGRILTVDEPPLAEALLIHDGVVTAIGSRSDVLALAGDGIPIIVNGDVVYCSDADVGGD